ncbi:MAG: spore germination protein, partial [Candidatus Saccharibacteria bacterium]
IPLIFSVAGSRESVPFPSFVEAFFLLVVFEILVEAGLRLPRVVGGAVNIVGALIIGQAAVSAGVVSPILVIVVAITAISNFALSTNYQLTSLTRVVRLSFLIASTIMGLYGISVAALAIVVYLTGLRSFGVPYMEPLAPLRLQEWQDVIYRAPKWKMGPRPGLIADQHDLQRNNTPPPTSAAEKSSEAAQKKHNSKGKRGEK